MSEQLDFLRVHGFGSGGLTSTDRRWIFCKCGESFADTTIDAGEHFRNHIDEMAIALSKFTTPDPAR